MKRYLPMLVMILSLERNVSAQGGISPPAAGRNENSRGSQGDSRGLQGGVPGGLIEPRNTLPPGVRERSPGVFNVTDPRPLEVATALLSLKLRIPVSYEEPAWEAKQDLMEAGRYPGNEKMAPRQFARLIPRGGSFDVIIPASPADPAAVIEAALVSHRNFQNPGEFKLITFGQGEFAIVPDRAGDKDGRMVQKSTPLDLRISFPEQERTFPATIDAVLQAVQSTGGVSIVALTHLNDTLYRKQRVGATNEKARDVLARVLNVPGGHKFSWSLRYDPHDKYYAFKLITVQEEVPIPGGGVGVRFATWPKSQSR